ncbi:hypothetical protein Pcinc_015611 [Petrolisthes cinctipes]|uniref:Uncharacterized protein n=1 Tax=Petrolisthes cinctipes TaxID=88211 RepID=A0AAE1FXZ2_PETCI|nr:hypothetical protein Pcinc_015611 [Petrolisthes cinctipes]
MARSSVSEVGQHKGKQLLLPSFPPVPLTLPTRPSHPVYPYLSPPVCPSLSSFPPVPLTLLTRPSHPSHLSLSPLLTVPFTPPIRPSHLTYLSLSPCLPGVTHDLDKGNVIKVTRDDKVNPNPA